MNKPGKLIKVMGHGCEYAYARRHLPAGQWKFNGQTLMEFDETPVDMLEFREENTLETRQFYFDISEFFDNEEYYEKMLASRRQ